jgi:hypothetical protein
MLTRWWAVRSQCCGALHQSLHNLNTLAAAVWPKDDKVDREAREVVTRYSVAAYQLLFLEARAGVSAAPLNAIVGTNDTRRRHTAHRLPTHVHLDRRAVAAGP